VSRILQRILLALFVVVDVVLIVAAVRHVNGTPPSSDLPTVAATAAPTPGEPEASPAANAQIPYDFKASEAVALSSANDGTIIYGTRGRCSDAPAEVMISTNGGTDFASAKTGLTTTLAVNAANASSITVVGTNAACEPRQVTSTNGGSSWTESLAIDLWYPQADNATTVVSPKRASEPRAGCVVTSVSQVTADSARVSCADGTLLGSGDNGATWVELGRLDNVRVSTFLTPSAGFALARYNGCGANQFSTTDGGATWTPGGCITGDPAQAISATTNGLAAVVANEAYVSQDGQVWTQP
jgi:hypothetical protein